MNCFLILLSCLTLVAGGSENLLFNVKEVICVNKEPSDCNIWKNRMIHLRHAYVECRRGVDAQNGKKIMACDPAWITIKHISNEDKVKYDGRIQADYSWADSNKDNLKVNLYFPHNSYTDLAKIVVFILTFVFSIIILVIFQTCFDSGQGVNTTTQCDVFDTICCCCLFRSCYNCKKEEDVFFDYGSSQYWWTDNDNSSWCSDNNVQSGGTSFFNDD